MLTGISTVCFLCAGRDFQGQGLGIIVWAFAKIGYDPSKIQDLLQAFAQEARCLPPMTTSVLYIQRVTWVMLAREPRDVNSGSIMQSTDPTQQLRALSSITSHAASSIAVRSYRKRH